MSQGLEVSNSMSTVQYSIKSTGKRPCKRQEWRHIIWTWIHRQGQVKRTQVKGVCRKDKTKIFGQQSRGWEQERPGQSLSQVLRHIALGWPGGWTTGQSRSDTEAAQTGETSDEGWLEVSSKSGTPLGPRLEAGGEGRNPLGTGLEVGSKDGTPLGI